MNVTLSSYIQLTKPSILLLVLAGGLTGIIMEGSLLDEPLKLSLFLLGLFLTGGCANALNQYFERDIDARMSRTCSRRPLPLQKLTPQTALLFSIIIGLTGTMILGLVFNWLTAFLAVATILFYGLVYTLWLKPSTSLNIVIGGVAGAMAPVGAWTAATGEMALTPWLVFLIIFFWTPPHFWSLAIRFNDDYRAARLPMLPLVRGRDYALRQIHYYTLVLFGVSLLPLAVQFGWFYLVTSTVLGLIFIRKTSMAKRTRDINKIWGVFKYSIVYLFAVFTALIINGTI